MVDSTWDSPLLLWNSAQAAWDAPIGTTTQAPVKVGTGWVGALPARPLPLPQPGTGVAIVRRFDLSEPR